MCSIFSIIVCIIASCLKFVLGFSCSCMAQHCTEVSFVLAHFKQTLNGTTVFWTLVFFFLFSFYYVHRQAPHIELIIKKNIITATKTTEKKTLTKKKEWWYIDCTIFMFCNTYHTVFFTIVFLFQILMIEMNKIKRE